MVGPKFQGGKKNIMCPSKKTLLALSVAGMLFQTMFPFRVLAEEKNYSSFAEGALRPSKTLSNIEINERELRQRLRKEERDSETKRSYNSRKSKPYKPPHYPPKPYPHNPGYPNKPPNHKPYQPPHHKPYQPPHHKPPAHKKKTFCYMKDQACDIFDAYTPVNAPTVGAVDRCPSSGCLCPNFIDTHSTTTPFYVQGTSKSVVCTNVPQYCTKFGCSSGTTPCMDVVENCCPGWCYSKWKEPERCTAFNTVAMTPNAADGQVGGPTCAIFQDMICPDEQGKTLVCNGISTNTNPGEPGWNYCQTYLPEAYLGLSAIPPPATPANDADKCFASCLAVVADSPDVATDLSCCCGTVI